MYEVRLTKQAEKDLQRILRTNLKKQVYALMELITQNPYQPPVEKLVGDLAGFYSRRINVQHRLVYKVEEDTKRIIILRMWSHYGDN